jgi:hypothetical protein
LNEEALDRTLWRTAFGRGCGPVVMQTTELMNEHHAHVPALTHIAYPRRYEVPLNHVSYCLSFCMTHSQEVSQIYTKMSWRTICTAVQIAHSFQATGSILGSNETTQWDSVMSHRKPFPALFKYGDYKPN